MKKTILAVFLLLFLAVNALGANYYFDLASGNDTTGDGTYGNPWKTIDKCTTSRSAGDECRGAKTTITTLSGTLTFTNGSTSVATSADQTAVVAAGDLVGKNSGLEGWWKVSSLNSTTITLTSQYWGLSGSGSAVTGYKITPVTASEEYDVNSSGSSGSYLKVSGGWDLSTQAQDGITAFSSSYTNSIDINAKSWVEVEKFIISSTSSTGITLGNGNNNYVHDCWVLETLSNGVVCSGLSAYNFKGVNLVGCGGTGTSFSLGCFGEYDTLYSFSSGTGVSDYGFSLSFTATYKNIRAYNSYYGGIYFSSEAFANWLTDTIVDTCRASTGGVIFATGAGESHLHSPTISGCTYGAYLNTQSWNNYLIGGSVSGTSSEYSTSPNAQSTLLPQLIIQNSGTDSRMIWNDGVIEHDSSAECRSGKCLKYTPSSPSYPLVYKVGSVKIPSASSSLTLKAYLKDDASFNGQVWYLAARNGRFISKTEKTPTTSYVQDTVVVASGDLVADEYLDLFVIVAGTAGNVYIDDFSAEQ